ncbi:SAM-dependent methyltransferase [Mycobacterium sp. MS1601]|uniref:SAM-dependent methyltransferase n=1 Tax=Mycobacterium sp. MS1601 TaxID=1936029 RepID=UPI00097906D1|nr:SAM-dependent methyltransferase [Mycobacterium sp. MS1601]AQA01720.1 SAM-dependent methyltransferase [Mycobacterium sp. MS1601]
MARTEGDSWDPASSVGTTATMVAAARAAATQAGRFIEDPWAAPLVRAVGIDFFTRMVDGELDIAQFPDFTPERAQQMIDAMALRTKFFDDYFLSASDAGIQQAVILASGLDSRAYRLPWPGGTTVYEIDQPQVIDFKTSTLTKLGAQPSALRRAIGVDLRDDWPAALLDAGWSAEQPTAWCAEGLLIYLPAEAQDRLFDTINGLSAPGSMIATEFAPGILDLDAERAAAASAAFAGQGLDLDMASLVYSGQRHSAADYLDQRGWDVTAVPTSELFSRNGLHPPQPDDRDALGEIVYISATYPGA